MVQSVELLYNQALSLAGSKGAVVSATETSREALLCTTWYETVRDNVMKASPWESLRADARLVKSSERNWGADWVSGDPAPQFSWSFALPSNMLLPRYLHSRARFELANSGGTRELMSNDEFALLRYTANDVAIVDWDSGLFSSVGFVLAAFISFELTKKVSISDRLWQRAYDMIATQQTIEANAQATQYFSVSEAHTARGYTGFATNAAYIYPYENLLGVSY